MTYSLRCHTVTIMRHVTAGKAIIDSKDVFLTVPLVTLQTVEVLCFLVICYGVTCIIM